MYDGRRKEIEAYILLVEEIEAETQNGPPRIGVSGATISVLQQRVLYANVYLHLYNLVEATISQCLGELCAAAADQGSPTRAADLAAPVREQWVRFTARTHIAMGADKRLEAALSLTDQLVASLPVGEFKIEAGGGGNWDDRSIESVADRVGCTLAVDGALRSSVRRHVKDDLGCMALVRSLRNDLAHGSLSFAECGANVTVADLKAVATPVLEYLEAVVTSFVSYLVDRRYLANSGAA